MFCRVCNVLAIFGDKKYGAESSFRDQNRRPVLNLFLEKSRFRESLDEHFHLGMNQSSYSNAKVCLYFKLQDSIKDITTTFKSRLAIFALH